MPENDERLQQYISQIEAGIPKEKVLASLSEGEQELVALIKLADAMRTISHPMPSPAYSRAAKQKILATVPNTRAQPQPRDRFQLGWLLFPSLTGAVAVFLVLFITLATLGVWLAGPANADVAMIQDVDGQVEVADNVNQIHWTPLLAGEVVRSGQQIRTLPGSSASIVFSDGSRAYLEEETTILLREVDGTWGGDLQIEIEQTIGKTSHKVIPLRSQTAFYTVRTPAGIARVHGTTFSVDVKANGTARIIVDSGQVAVTNSADEVMVPAGQATLMQVGKAPVEAGNFFTIVDFVVSIDGFQWAVSGQKFSISDQTTINGTPAIGQALKIEGRILASGKWVADQIGPVDTTARSVFTGIIESIANNRLRIGGKNIRISKLTQMDPLLEVGDSVEVTYLPLSESNWLATTVVELEKTAQEVGESTAQEPEQPTPLATNTVESVVAAFPTLSAETVQALCESAESSAEIDGFATSIDADVKDVKELICDGLSFEEIRMANELSLKHAWSLLEIGYMYLSGMGWEEIDAAALLFQTPGVTAGSAMCNGNENNPKAEFLANKYNLPYKQVNDLFCLEGYNFGSINLALKIAAETQNGNPESLLQSKLDGKNWGQIKKESNQAKNEEKQEEKVAPGKPEDPGTSNTSDNANKDKDKEPKTPPGQEKKEK